MLWVIVPIVSICFLALGFWAGHKFATEKAIKESIGALRVDNSDPDDNPYLFLEIDQAWRLNTIADREYVTLRVNVQNYISQK